MDGPHLVLVTLDGGRVRSIDQFAGGRGRVLGLTRPGKERSRS